jgi:hypothetical protein
LEADVISQASINRLKFADNTKADAVRLIFRFAAEAISKLLELCCISGVGATSKPSVDDVIGLRNMYRSLVVLLTGSVICTALLWSAPSNARSGGSQGGQHKDLTITKRDDKSSPKMMSNKPGNKFKPTKYRADPYKNYNFR